jgi:hypothetical protein
MKNPFHCNNKSCKLCNGEAGESLVEENTNAS